MTGEIRVRTATRDDARAISHIRVETWRAAYAGLIAQEVLDQLDAESESERRIVSWTRRHADSRMLDLIAERDGTPVGWAAAGPSDDRERPHDGQLYALYAVPSEWSRGVGHALLLAAEEMLRAAGFRHAHLWVLEGNERAAGFYERHAWREDGGVMVDERVIGGHTAFTLHERRRVRDLAEALSERPERRA
ncbi:GNAT family N-acetyltransferase [Microbacterium sp. CFH 90308]|uniref:GNAT family N-acetyltransferase n=1 Tax=Microbacterium salsuginis TaxID=2722803 RepID=A0ABX1K943_9MICO|nr:GNAT family N-acetyltransferase [Microbacterium sp. CFH 90308]NLP82878.1 GNAT family N-acetyltransferase [Microbacterium sp. CFH 90308]